MATVLTFNCRHLDPAFFLEFGGWHHDGIDKELVSAEALLSKVLLRGIGLVHRLEQLCLAHMTTTKATTYTDYVRSVHIHLDAVIVHVEVTDATEIFTIEFCS